MYGRIKAACMSVSALFKLAPIAAVLTSVLLLISGNALVGVVAPVRASLDGFGDLTVGLLGSAYFAGMLLGTLYTPAMVRRSGHIRAFAGFVAVLCVATALMPVAETPALWMLSRALVGFVLAGVYAIVESWIHGAATNANRGALYAIYQFVNFGATSIGQLLMRVIDPRSFLSFNIGAALSALAILPLAITQADTPEPPREVKLKLATFRALSSLSLLAALVAGICNGASISLGPVYALQIGVEPQAVPLFTASIVIGSSLGVYPVGRMSDRLDRRLIMAITMGLGAAFEIALAVWQPTGAPLVGFGFLVGLTTYTLYTLATAIANDRAEPHDMVLVSAALLFVYCVGAIVSPALVSLEMRAFGPSALYWQNGAAHAALAAYAAWRRISSRRR